MNPFMPLASKSIITRPAGELTTDQREQAAQDAYNASLQENTQTIRTALIAEVVVIGVVEVVGVSLSAYHGYKRNHNSTGSAVAWGLAGFFFPIIVPVVAVVQGYAKPE